MYMNTFTSAFGKLDQNDFIKGFIVAVITAVLTFLYPTLLQHTLPSLSDTLYTAATAGVAYLIKNFFTPSQEVVPPAV